MKTNLNIKGMHCASCSKIIEMELGDKVKSISVSHETGKAVIDFDEKKISLQQIKNIIKEAGYKTD
ncbi:MAG: heavy-metal-associated domain-containing protein [Nanoarchaeota archaeon]|nr:heavy-metal-associated domain-containing protein [Nanoarchaeota archaeon]